jgi:hypothetical protein
MPAVGKFTLHAFGGKFVKTSKAVSMSLGVKKCLKDVTGKVPRRDAERLGAKRYGLPRLSALDLLGTNGAPARLCP